jgi:hypothetical protein
LMRKELITLSREEHDRLLIVRKVMKREMSQVEAADLRLLVISSPSIAMKRRQTQVLERFDGTLIIRFNGRNLDYREVQDLPPCPRSSLEAKRIPEKPKKPNIPAPDHPWRRWEPQLHHNSSLERICR